MLRRRFASSSRKLLLLLTIFILVSIISGKAAKAGIRTKLNQKSRKAHQGLGKQFGSWGTAHSEGFMTENLNQLGDEDEMEVVDDIEPDPDEEEYEEYIAEEETVDTANEGEISNEIRPEPKEESKQASTTSDTEIINTLLDKGYDWRVRPPGTNLSLPGSHGPVVVRVNMLVRSISKIDDVNMEYSVQLTFREEWIDGRLAYGLPRDNKPDFLILAAGQQIWMPDSFFQNEKNAQKHMIDKPNVLIRIHKDGQILYSVRISLVLSCPMHLHNYPMDIQTCLIDLASYAYTDNDIVYMWRESDPVQLKGGLESSLPSFQLNNVNTTYCTSKTNTGTYSCLRTVLTLQRQFSYYLLQLYIPSTMLVIVSWVSFWLDRNAVPARVTLGVTTLLTITTQASGINAKLPPVSYVKAVDLWIGACMTFIFSALLEFAAVTYISSRKFYKQQSVPKASLGATTFMSTHPMSNTPLLLPALPPSHQNEPEVWVKQRPSQPSQTTLLRNSHGSSSNNNDIEFQQRRRPRQSAITQCLKSIPLIRYLIKIMNEADSAKKVDYVSRALFPACFLTFNILYWSSYSSKYQE